MNNSHKIQLYSACLLLSVANADQIIDKNEIYIIKDIIQDFFSISEQDANNLLKEAKIELINSTGLFNFGQFLNQNLKKEEKLDLIFCIYELAYADNSIHYLENHTIKKIANILNIDKQDIISIKSEIQNYLND